MFLQTIEITPQSHVKDIVNADHRTVDVFRRYDMEYCCGARWPLETLCLMKGIEVEELIAELHRTTRTLQLPVTLPFEKWPVDFLADYIIHVHHTFLREFLPACWPVLNQFVNEHLKKYPWLYEVQSLYRALQRDIIPHLAEEEQVIFPYIRQLDHAQQSGDSYGALLVKTLRKPVDKLVGKEHRIIQDTLHTLRRLTSDYNPPLNACTSHKVVMGKLRELDNDLVQHMYLENEVLFPQAMRIEKELLDRFQQGGGRE